MREMWDSGIPWIGPIPEGWKPMRLKYLLNERNLRSSTGSETLLSVSVHNGVVPSSELGQRTAQADSLIGYKIVRSGDMVFNKLNPNMARFGYSLYEGITSPEFAIYYPQDPVRIDLRFLVYLIRTPRYVERIKQLTSGVGEGFARLYTDDLFGISISLPPLEEQRHIADYLDERCDAIDEAKKPIEDEVESLRRFRKATIFKAVTKGLDIEVQTRDSGVEWIGMVPDSWETPRFKTVYRQVKRTGHPDEELLSVYLNYGVIRFSDDDGVRVHKTSADTSGYQLVLPGDLVMNNQQAWRGSVGVSSFRGIVSPAYHVYQVIENEKVDDRYANYMFRSCMVPAYELCSHGVGTIQRNISADEFGYELIPLPPIDEQQRIADYLDERCMAIDSIIEVRTKQLERLEDYRKALIFAYATGKKEVPAS